MTAKDRQERIHEFLDTQRYLFGVKAKVDLDPDDEDKVAVVLEKATQRQVISLQHAFRNCLMGHIKVSAIEIVKEQQQKKK